MSYCLTFFHFNTKDCLLYFLKMSLLVKNCYFFNLKMSFFQKCSTFVGNCCRKQIPGWQSLPMSFYSLLASMVSDERLHVNFYYGSFIHYNNFLLLFQDFHFQKFYCDMTRCDFLCVYYTWSFFTFLNVQINVFIALGIFRLLILRKYFLLLLFFFWNLYFVHIVTLDGISQVSEILFLFFIFFLYATRTG